MTLSGALHFGGNLEFNKSVYFNLKIRPYGFYCVERLGKEGLAKYKYSNSSSPQYEVFLKTKLSPGKFLSYWLMNGAIQHKIIVPFEANWWQELISDFECMTACEN